MYKTKPAYCKDSRGHLQSGKTKLKCNDPPFLCVSITLDIQASTLFPFCSTDSQIGILVCLCSYLLHFKDICHILLSIFMRVFSFKPITYMVVCIYSLYTHTLLSKDSIFIHESPHFFGPLRKSPFLGLSD